MLLLVSGATTYKRSATVGHLIVPGQWNDPAGLELSHPWAMDNGAFAGFDAGAYLRMLERFHPYRALGTCRFVTAPDVLSRVHGRVHGDAAATFAQWPFWSQLLRGLGWTPAYVAQDGLGPHLIPNLVGERAALFIGGSTAFKESAYVRELCGYAKARGIWVHWGRVNGKRRYELAQLAGADSIDGTGFSMYPDTTIPKVTQWQREIATHGVLPLS